MCLEIRPSMKCHPMYRPPPPKHIFHTLFKHKTLFEKCDFFFLNIVLHYKYCGCLTSMLIESYSRHYVNCTNTTRNFIVCFFYCFDQVFVNINFKATRQACCDIKRNFRRY